ncbi:HNH endonuclease signature motif containing protein [Burkholderia cepacia]|uniref:HNH endonuclease signature motif containing protein n=1 Tax=Burkholderia cepacia TaxID=292 RepID=UPI0009BD74E1|nr:HNH endonuclease signature motif containing protein [Burkholderia cepacia]
MKLRAADVIVILTDRRPEADLAAQFGVAKNTINRIRTGARWAHVAPEIQRWRRYVDAESITDVIAQRTERDSVTGCLNWTGATQSEGYGIFSFGGKLMLVHRAAYQEVHGEIPDGLVVMHGCDNRRCCNESHLRLGTDQDNKDDCVAKGRHSRGESHPTAKLTAEEVKQIRADSRNQRALASEFGVSQSQISHIKTFSQWRESA